MNIHTIYLENFRSYKKGQGIENIRPITVFIGANNAGKSNIINALVWYKDMSMDNANFNTELLHVNNKLKPMRITIEFSLGVEERQSLVELLPFKTTEIAKSMLKPQFFQKIKHEFQFNPNGNFSEEVLSIENFSGSWLPVLGYSHNQIYPALWKTDIDNLAKDHITEGDIKVSQDSKKRIGERVQKLDRVFVWEPSKSQVEDQLKKLLISYIERWTWISPIRKIER